MAHDAQDISVTSEPVSEKNSTPRSPSSAKGKETSLTKIDPSSKNINDPSYREGQATPTKFKGKQTGGTIQEQMTEAIQAPEVEKARKQIERKKSARQQMVDNNQIVERRERGVPAAFAAGRHVEHRRGEGGKSTSTERGGIRAFGVNPRPAQRVHEK